MKEQDSVASREAVKIHRACRDHGFFYVVEHAIDQDLQKALYNCSSEFFDLPLAEKREIRMELGGSAWRGYFEVGMELTSGIPDRKEGIYFGQELGNQHPKIRDKVPMHGQNLFPSSIPSFMDVVRQYMESMTVLGHLLMRGLALSLQLPGDFFRNHYTTDPLVLFRIFHYPPVDQDESIPMPWGVGEHTDYGVLTILKQDDVGGLQIKTKEGWIDAPYVENAFICNIGDMLDLMTGGYYLSTPHRVQNRAQQSRYSFPFFFDPNFDSKMQPLAIPDVGRSVSPRWDGKDLQTFQGTYGEYILDKIAKVFPDLFGTG